MKKGISFLVLLYVLFCFNFVEGQDLGNDDFVIDENGVLIQYTGNSYNVVVPDGVTRIADRAFSMYPGDGSLTIPDSVTEIGEHALWGPEMLIVNAGSYAESWAIENDWRFHRTGDGDFTVVDGTLYSYVGTESAPVIPSDVNRIGRLVFYGNNSIESISIPDGVTYIGSNAFSYCRNLTNISIPGSVQNLGVAVFHGSDKLESVVIPEGVTTIGSSLFDGCSNLTSVTLPSTVTEIKTGAFWGCSSLTSLIIPDNVRSIENRAFENCNNLENLTIPKNIQSIGDTNVIPLTTTLSVYEDSYAAQWAEENGYSYVIIDGENPEPPVIEITATSEYAYDYCQTEKQMFTVSLSEDIIIPAGTLLYARGVDRVLVADSDRGVFDFSFLTRKCVDESCTWISSTDAYTYAVTFKNGANHHLTTAHKGVFNSENNIGTRSIFALRPFGTNENPFTISGLKIVVTEPGDYVVYAFVPLSEEEKLIPTNYYAKVQIKIDKKDDSGICNGSAEQVNGQIEGPEIGNNTYFTYSIDTEENIEEPVTGNSKGNGQNHLIGSGVSSVFTIKRTSDDERTFDLFRGIQVDGQDVDAKYYKAEKGSVKITLSSEYLDSLKTGDHILTAVFEDGTHDVGFEVSEPFVVPVKFTTIRSNSSYFIPTDLKDQKLTMTLSISGFGISSMAENVELDLENLKNRKDITVDVLFDREIKDFSNDYKVTITKYPQKLDADIFSQDGTIPQYNLKIEGAPGQIEKDKFGLNIFLIWNDDAFHKPEVIAVYALPEDEIGAYALRDDGTKEYLLFHTYAICMNYLGRDELCRGYERCFHKESPFVNPFVKP